MRSIVGFVALLAATACAFAPQSRTTRSNRLFSAASAPVVKASKSPLDNLPWNVRKVQEREARRIRREAAKLYRELGIAEDSTYEEIVHQTEMLRARAKDFKAQIKIDLAKDKILEMRLSERIAGLAKVSAEVRSQDTYEREGVDESLVRNSDDDDDDLVPSAWKGIVVKPDDVWRDRQLKVWGIITAIGIVFPTAIETMAILQLMVLTAQLLYRGQIIEPGNMWSLSSGERAKGSHRTTSWFLGLGILFGGKMLAFLLTPPFAKGKRWTPTVGFMLQNLIYMFSNMFLQPYKGD